MMYKVSCDERDYKVLERYMRQYHDYVKQYKDKPTDMSQIKYERLKAIVEGITQTYNDASLFEQQLIKLSWWENESDDVIQKVLNRGKLTIEAFREKVLREVANNTGYIV
ncbi:hypothetical protein MKY53_05505 [Macrococcus sp. FSL R5-0951]